MAATVPDDDASLLRAVVEGDPQAYRCLVNRHSRKIFAYVSRTVASPAEAEEVTQETFLRLWQNAHSHRGQASVKTWLFRIAHNLSIDRLRKRREQLSDQKVAEALAPESVRGLVDTKHRAQAVAQAIAQLPERQRAALNLVHYSEMSNLEASAVMGVNVRALESLLARARATLRQSLGALRSASSNGGVRGE